MKGSETSVGHHARRVPPFRPNGCPRGTVAKRGTERGWSVTFLPLPRLAGVALHRALVADLLDLLLHALAGSMHNFNTFALDEMGMRATGRAPGLFVGAAGVASRVS